MKNNKTEEAKDQRVETVEETNARLVETLVRFLGDKSTISQVVMLLAYIRHAVKNNLRKDITVQIGKNVVNKELLFDVNSQEIDDYITKDFIEIN